ncbi:MAG: hypothetical protein EHM28_03815 [Spirochaetaceae bacterium]|nr:MAG: hypothetical protein EHM28_03815 [Spirochaetaceae bacterium]
MRIIFTFLLLLISIPAFSQVIADPTEKIYEYITIWEGKGYVNNLPLLRPYPHTLLKQILENVIQKGDQTERELAQSWYDELFYTFQKKSRPGRLLPTPFGIRFINDLWFDTDDYLYATMLNLQFQDQVTDWFSYSGFMATGFKLFEGYPEPVYTRIEDDSISGGSNFNIGELEANGMNNSKTMIFFGNQDLYLQAGISRSVFGPFWDNSGIIGSHAPSTGHISFTWNPGWGCFTSVLLPLHPKYYESNMDPGDPFYDGNNGTTQPIPSSFEPVEKYLILHSWSFRIADWFTFTLLQSVVFGERFVWAYLFPLQHLTYTQLLMGDVDSSYIGVITEFDLPANIDLDLMLYIDDFNMDKFMGGDGALFDINSGQNKVAFQAGLTWTPGPDVATVGTEAESGEKIQGAEVFRKISISYFMVTPYTYTHNGSTEAATPYLSYTHEGVGLGTILPPNSDKIALTAFLQPTSWCDIQLFSYFMRHGNASEDVAGLEATSNGSYWDDGRDWDGTVSFYGSSRFMAQDVIEKILQIGFYTDFRFNPGFGKLLLGIGYTFEYGWDRGLNPGDNGARNIFSFTVGIEL